MGDGKISGEQCDLFFRQRTGRAVSQVAYDGVTDVGQLCPDLVMPPGFQIDFHQTPGPACINYPVTEPNLLGLIRFSADDPARPAGYPFEMVDKSSGFFLQNPFDHGDVLFFHRLCAKLSAQAAGRL